MPLRAKEAPFRETIPFTSNCRYPVDSLLTVVPLIWMFSGAAIVSVLEADIVKSVPVAVGDTPAEEVEVVRTKLAFVGAVMDSLMVLVPELALPILSVPPDT